jgi:hypothetical protein
MEYRTNSMLLNRKFLFRVDKSSYLKLLCEENEEKNAFVIQGWKLVRYILGLLRAEWPFNVESILQFQLSLSPRLTSC